MSSELLSIAADVTLAPAPDWVVVAHPDFENAGTTSAAARERDADYLLYDRQVDVQAQEDYFRVAMKVMSEGGLQEAGRWSATYDPEYQTVTFHRIDVHRGGEVMDRLAEAEFRYLEQETESSMHLYNGKVTALTLLPDLRVGDVVDVAYTVTGRNPVFGGHYFDSFSLGWGQPVSDLRSRVRAPADLRLRYRQEGEGGEEPTMTFADGFQMYAWHLKAVPTYVYEEGTPAWYSTYPWAELSAFETWSGVVEWALPLYAAANDAPVPALRAEVAQALDPEILLPRENGVPLQSQPADLATRKDRVAALLDYVQREIRYLGIELGVSSHRPHPPEETFARRFGDCKDKALLLVQLLRSQGIEAAPVLVNTMVGEKLGDRLPSPSAFNHVIVGVRLDGAWHWLDPTMAPHRGALEQRAAPDYGYGLVLLEGETELRRVDQPTEAQRRIDSRERLRLEGIGQPASLQVVTLYHGAAAVSMRRYFNGSTPEQISQSYQEYYANIYPDATIDGPPTLQDMPDGSLQVVESYTIREPWVWIAESSTWRMETFALLTNSYLPDGLSATRRTPRSLEHPVQARLEQVVELPDAWDLELPNVEIDSDVFNYQRQSHGGGTNRLTIVHTYASKTSHVRPRDMPTYVRDIAAARELLGMELTKPQTDAGSIEEPPFAPNLLMFLIAIGGFSGALVALVWWVRHQHRRPPPLGAGPSAKLTGLGGWLILPALGLVFFPFRLIATLVTDLAAAFDQNVWVALTTPGIETSNMALAGLILGEVLANVVWTALVLVTLVMFFRRDRCLPTLMRAVIIYGLVVVILDTVALDRLDLLEAEEKALSVGQVIRQVLAAAIWVPYFSVSQRVRNTFVR